MTSLTILDGGMSRELQRLGAPFRQPEWSALAMMETPDIVKQAHKEFIQAGSRVVTTNSYALVPFHIGEQVFKDRVAELATNSVAVAHAAVAESGENVLVAASVPPLFGSYRADLYEADRFDEIARPLVTALQAGKPDVWLNETQSLLAETLAMKALIDSIDTDHRPYWVSFTLEDFEPSDTPKLRSGETVREAVQAMAEAGVDAIMFNCSQPETISDAIRVTKEVLASNSDTRIQNIKVGAYANAFAPQPKDATANDGLDEVRPDLTPDTYTGWVKEWKTLGADMIGGCCGIGVEHIAAIKALNL
ncbi:homocysteine S-methyltransferase family protein [Parathalassolituus penaei]|uniref:Homocysteine S-methyltransferase family protein n=1 Tax=Parathalassolituus penaei TaxID=2997323 RepID=A0A9X3ED88_9GAMM|nr:homocysteine S-methyltransferase family protein [Parathalassolituus penaei]MCY0965477.1 homocysteine S-methyltransferase family protein [Parathalassolituus penaei]